MPLDNSPIPFTYRCRMPDGWATTVDRQVLSGGLSETIVYDTPRYKGKIWWSENRYWGDLPHTFTHDGKEYQSSDGHELHVILGISEDYCVRSGAGGWQKALTKDMFEVWLKQDLPKEPSWYDEPAKGT